MKKKRTLITSALLYANGSLHFGHFAGAFLPADSYARFRRLMGDDVLFISGSDEYGIAITMKAEIEGRTPKDQVDYYHEINKKLFKRMNVSFDYYSRTTWEGHNATVQEYFLDLLAKGLIEERETEQLYSEVENRFLADRYVEGECPKCGFEKARGDECPKCAATFDAMDLKNPVSKMTQSKLILKKTKHWFLLADKMKQPLLSWISKKNWKSTVVNFVEPYIKDLKPRSITRDLDWGVPVPLENTEGKVLYVWFDAPIGYISASKDWAKSIEKPNKWKDYWLEPDTKYVQFIGKDNIVFHAVFFPAMTMGQKQPYKLVDDLPANEFLNLEGKQFSKSTGWYIDLEEFLNQYPVDTLRYALAANAPESQDSEFTWKDFQIRVNSELVGKFGNFIYRTLSFINTKMDQKIPEAFHYDEKDAEFAAKLDEIAKATREFYDTYHLRKVVGQLMELSSLANAYFDAKKPWNLLKNKESSDELNTTMYMCLSAIKTLALLAFPIIPESAEKIWKMIGFESSLETCLWQEVMNEDLEPGRPLIKPTLLFEKIEDHVIEVEMAKLHNSINPSEKLKTKDSISFEDFQNVDLRVAKILDVEKVPKSSKLLKITVDLGFEKRIIVSGIAKHFKNLDELLGKQVIVVANLEPATIMGIKSEGMILAASEGNLLELPEVKGCPPGGAVS